MAKETILATDEEVQMLKDAVSFGSAGAPPVIAAPPKPKVVLVKAVDVLKAKKPELPPVEIPVVEPPAKPAPKAETVPKGTEPVKPEPKLDLTLTKDILEETGKELESLQAALGTTFTPEMDDKMGKAMDAKVKVKIDGKEVEMTYLDKLIKHDQLSPKQAVTQLALMVQGFVKIDKENHALIQRTIKEVKSAADLQPAAPAPVSGPENTEDLIGAWAKNNHSTNSPALGKLLNVDQDVDTVMRAMGMK